MDLRRVWAWAGMQWSGRDAEADLVGTVLVYTRVSLQYTVKQRASYYLAFFCITRRPPVIPFLFLFLLFCILAGCGKKETPLSQRATKVKVSPIDPATVGDIQGRITLEGPAPISRPIDMSADPGCRGTNASESIVGQNGGLANVFVYIKDGVEDHAFLAPQAPVVIEQNGCRYRPHVAGAMVEQKIEFRNTDPTTHNIHASAQRNAEWNESQPPNAPLIQKSFANPEVMLAVKCNQHPWMRMYVNVVSSPFYAVSGMTGQYEIAGIPPGNYTLAFVHEKLGEHDVTVSVGPRESKTLNATFNEP